MALGYGRLACLSDNRCRRALDDCQSKRLFMTTCFLGHGNFCFRKQKNPKISSHQKDIHKGLCNQEAALPNKAYGHIRDVNERLVFHLLTHQVCSGTSQSWHVSGSMKFSLFLIWRFQADATQQSANPTSRIRWLFPPETSHLRPIQLSLKDRQYQGSTANTLNGLLSNHP